MLKFEPTENGDCVITFKGRSAVAVLHKDLHVTIIGPETFTAAELFSIAEEVSRFHGNPK